MPHLIPERPSRRGPHTPPRCRSLPAAARLRRGRDLACRPDRHSGDPFITHCVAVAAIVADIGMPPAVVSAPLLHDIEDTPARRAA
ncbi:HD domain-containing protein [Streptomyces sp. NPDC046832]|uniref:HD domain-containing protein n=1 Tax=Streptomyces sp. NPDC046832 TaxID=3155020 RepID=UPI00340BB7D6